MDPWTLLLLVAGAVLVGSEFVAPSLLAMFVGAAAFVTAGLRALGVVESVPLSLLVWAVTALGMVLPFRPLVQRLVPGRSVVKRDRTDVETDRESMGEIVEVVEDISDENDAGRIRFQGTTWQARATTGRFGRGEKVQLVYRQDAVWVVEAVGAGADGGARELFAVTADAAGEAAVDTPAEAAIRRR
jgi:membrane protein implicated in regulation of membrane protease activity